MLKWDDEVYINLNLKMTRQAYGEMMREREGPSASEKDDLSFLDDMSEEENGTEEPPPDSREKTGSD